LSMYSSQPIAPGREGASGPGTPAAPAAPGQQGAPGTTADSSPPPQSAPGGGLPMSMLLMALPLLLIFLTMRGQSKKQKAIEQNLKTGDMVITQSGLIGKVIEFVGETRVKVEIAPGVSVRMLKSAITGVDGGEAKDVKDKDAKDKDVPKDKPQEKKA
jgi:preprotein translocase subunit YajC